MDNNDLIEAFEKASKNLQKNATVSSGAVKIEKEYSTAYQRLVTVGLKPQLKAKYR